MKMICEVPDEVIKCIKDGTWCGSSVAEKMIANGIPLSSSEKQKPKSEWEQDHEILKAYSDGANEVLDKVRAEISERSKMHMDGDLYIKTSDCMQIIDEFTAEEDKA